MTRQTDRELIQQLVAALEVLQKEAVTTSHNQTIVVGGVAHPIPVGSDLMARDAICAHLLDRARACLAEPEPQGVTRYGEDFWRKDALEKLVHAATSFRVGVYSAEELEIFENRAHAVLAQWGNSRVEPVPAAERPWERDRWCDAAGRCWFFWPEDVSEMLGDAPVIQPPSWEYRKPDATELYPLSLPHDAIPFPKPSHEDQH